MKKTTVKLLKETLTMVLLGASLLGLCIAAFLIDSLLSRIASTNLLILASIPLMFFCMLVSVCSGIFAWVLFWKRFVLGAELRDFVISELNRNSPLSLLVCGVLDIFQEK